MSDEILDWTKLPAQLNYLAQPAERYGRFQFDNIIDDYLFNKMSKADVEELRNLRDRMAQDFDIIELWLDEFNMRIHPEARLVYFMRDLIGTADDTHLL